MRKKQANATTIRLEAEDKEAIARIRELYGCPSESAAIKLAVRMVARGEQPQRQPPTPSPK
jgi:coenzyme F420-reducing hydrogenase gamma subunit